MDFPEHVLDFFKIIAPSPVLDRKKILHNIAEALDADAETVKRGLGTVAQSAVMQLATFGPMLQSEVFEERAAQANAAGPDGQRFAPLAPLFAVEIFEYGLGFVLLLVFATAEDFKKSTRGRIVWLGLSIRSVRKKIMILLRCRQRQRVARVYMNRSRRQFLHPLHHYVYIAQCPEALKQTLASLFHCLPIGVGVHRHQPVGQRTTAAQRDAQVVNRIGAKIGGNVLALLQNPKHPVAKANDLLGPYCVGGCGSHEGFEGCVIGMTIFALVGSERQ